MPSVAQVAGSYTNTFLRKVFYGPSCLEKAVPESLQLLSTTRKALIITGKSLATKTDVVRRVERALGDAHVGTFAEIGQHAPVADIRAVIKAMHEKGADVLIALGGGSPIDSAKAVSYMIHEDNPKTKDNKDESSYLPIIAIPTTLSVAETTQNAGYTSEEGNKTGVSSPALVPRIIIYDAELTLDTPEKLWLSTGMRALDHAIELLYRPGDSSILQGNALHAIRQLFYLLPASKRAPKDITIRQRLQLACYNSLSPESRLGALGLSHSMGHALGATYAIPHGITTCLTLPGAIAVTSQMPTTSTEHLLALSDALNFIPSTYYAAGDRNTADAASEPAGILATRQHGAGSLSRNSHDHSTCGVGGGCGGEEPTWDETIRLARARGMLVSQAVRQLIEELGLHTTLRQYNVPKDDFVKIAQHVTRGKDESLQQLIVALLQAKYEDPPERL